MDLNNLTDRVVIIPKAITSKSGEAEFHIHLKSSRTNSIVICNKNTFAVTVLTTSLLDFFKKENISNVDYIKMDIEGAEYDVLLNLTNQELDLIQEIQLEYHLIECYLPGSNTAELKEKLISLFTDNNFYLIKDQKQILTFKK